MALTRGGCWLPSRAHNPADAGSIPAPASLDGEPMTDEELRSFYEYAGKNMVEPDGSQCQWADYSVRCVEEIRRLRAHIERWKQEEESWKALCQLLDHDRQRYAKARELLLQLIGPGGWQKALHDETRAFLDGENGENECQGQR